MYPRCALERSVPVAPRAKTKGWAGQSARIQKRGLSKKIVGDRVTLSGLQHTHDRPNMWDTYKAQTQHVGFVLLLTPQDCHNCVVYLPTYPVLIPLSCLTLLLSATIVH